MVMQQTLILFTRVRVPYRLPVYFNQEKFKMKYNENELYHHGIKGQKWGVRRFQNRDGTRTPLGKRHEVQIHNDYARAHTKKSIKEMSDDELRMRNNRLNMELQYKQLTDRQKHAGRKFVETMLTDSVREIAKDQTKKRAKRALGSVLI